MSKTLVELWIEALAIGRYDQTNGTLRDADGYCCLGVVCNLYDSNRWRADGDTFAYYVHGEREIVDFLPYDVQEILGLGSQSGAFDFDTLPIAFQAEVRKYHPAPSWRPASLVDLNDNFVPFSVIAKVIAARPTGLFIEPLEVK